MPRAKMHPKQRTAFISIAAAVFLVLLKLVTGVITGSIGLVSAGVESSGDVIAALVTFFAIRLAHRPADTEHPYGHGRVENLSALAEAGILAAGGAFIASAAVGRLREGVEPPDTSWYVFAVLGGAIVLDVARTVISFRTSRRYRSAALRSNAYNFAGDFFGSVAVMVGLVLVSAGYADADAAAALFVSCLIFVGAGRLIWENTNTLMDAAPLSTERAVRDAIESIELPLRLRRLRVRESGGRAFADVVVTVPPAAAVGQGHATADAIEQAIAGVYPDSDVVVHVEPDLEHEALRERVLAAVQSVPRLREAHNVNVFTLEGRHAVSLHVKLPKTLSLGEAERASAQVEEAIRKAAPELQVVQIHTEPLTEPLEASEPESPVRDDLERVVRAVVEREDASLEQLLPIETDRGTVLFLTLALDPRLTLAEAHRIASEIEETIHARAGVTEVVIKTRPAETP
ncbi:MAG: cation diffusion facilitator family transporter [Gaiellaceae bacterium]